MTDDVDPRELADATASFLEDRADGERVLEHVLEVDDGLETWTFDDLEVDSEPSARSSRGDRRESRGRTRW